MAQPSWIGLLLAVTGASTCSAQSVDPSLTFEVASVKPAPPPASAEGKRMIRIGVQGGPGTSDPGQMSYSFVSLRNLLMQAFGVKRYQITGPDWLDSERFNIVAKVPMGATKDDAKIMLRNLLKERFQLAFHSEQKVVPVYELVVGKNGPKLKESQDQSDPAAVPPARAPSDGPAVAPTPPAPTPTDPARIKIGKDGMPEFPPGTQRPGIMTMAMMSPAGIRMRLNAQRQTMAQLADALSNHVDRPVVDMTGLSRRYDFTLDFAPDQDTFTRMTVSSGGLPPPPPAGAGVGGVREATPNANLPETDAATLFAAIQSQLGLKLEAKKTSTDLIVVDHLEKTPSEN